MGSGVGRDCPRQRARLPLMTSIKTTGQAGSLDDELPSEHPHLAGELILAALLGQELDRSNARAPEQASISY